MKRDECDERKEDAIFLPDEEKRSDGAALRDAGCHARHQRQKQPEATPPKDPDKNHFQSSV